MAVKVKPEFIDSEQIKNAGRRIEVDISCIDWKKVIQVARAEGKRIEEVLGVPVLEPYSKPEGFEERQRQRMRTISQTATERFSKAIDARADRLGATTAELLIISRLSLIYSSANEEDFTDLKTR